MISSSRRCVKFSWQVYPAGDCALQPVKKMTLQRIDKNVDEVQNVDKLVFSASGGKSPRSSTWL